MTNAFTPPNAPFCSAEALDLRRSPIPVPLRFHGVPFVFDRYPAAPGVSGLTGGANCQQYAYEFLREHGFSIGDLRSSNLWEDTKYTDEVTTSQAFDLALVHDRPDAWGAHVMVAVGSDMFCTFQSALAGPPWRHWPRSWRVPTTST
ncbi:hypothetical protein [Comamonas sp.]|uniref:hypothetical protein n=1 Tax=Comamonas sp. TaxID=34028 RepID=UPI0028B1AB65|nr:hypothetical protein [Comamonas sp.]